MYSGDPVRWVCTSMSPGRTVNRVRWTTSPVGMAAGAGPIDVMVSPSIVMS